MRALHPSFVRATASVLAQLAVVITATYLWQGYHEHSWWSRGYFMTLLIPIVLVPAFTCTVFVPLQLGFSDTHFIIHFPFRRVHTLSWDDLKYYGWLQGVYGLQFRSAGMFSFYPLALPRHEWRLLKTFLFESFPERKASGFVGATFFKWRSKKK